MTIEGTSSKKFWLECFSNFLDSTGLWRTRYYSGLEGI